jgi:hypothetical protein
MLALQHLLKAQIIFAKSLKKKEAGIRQLFKQKKDGRYRHMF